MEDSKKAKRSTTLIADFKDGYIVGWHFCLKDAFREALDIKKTARVLKGQQQEVWTQGKNFNFKEGDLIHDVRDQATWGAMLESINHSVQVVAASPASDGTQGAGNNPGLVKFQLSELSADRSKMIPIKRYECTQIVFIELLQTGKLSQNDREELNITVQRIPT